MNSLLKPPHSILAIICLSMSSMLTQTTEATVRWRAVDGKLETPPPTAEASMDAASVFPKTKGNPVFLSPFAIKKGDVISFATEVEIIVTEADSGAEGQAGVVLTMLPASSKNNYNPDAEHRQIVIVGTQSEEIRFAFRSKSAYGTGELLMVPTISYFGRPLRLTKMRWENHGSEADPQTLTQSSGSYPGQELDAPWRAQADEQIDRYRKADFQIQVVDRWGAPVSDLDIAVEQIRHAYPFGTAVVASRIVDAPREFAPDSGMTTELWLADNARYRKEIERNFNAVVFENDLKWPMWNGSNEAPANYDQQWTLRALDWFHHRQFTVKGHTIIWGSWRFSPPWLREKEGDLDAIQKAVLAHIRDIGNATADRTQLWDVLNEPMSHVNLIKLLGMDAVAEWFKEARAALPGVRLVMNEFDIVGNGGNEQRRADFTEFYHELVKRDAPIDVLGFQGHFWSDRFTAPTEVWRIIDEMHVATGLPFMISEFDINVPNEVLQAEYTRDFLTAWFAHPNTEAFIMWGFWGRAHWMGETGAMYRNDWSEKPSLLAYRDLVFRRWWTNASAATDLSGKTIIRAFQGRHRVTVTPPNGGAPIMRELDLPKEGRSVTIVIP